MEWISVKERMPEKFIDVIAAHITDGWVVAAYMGRYKKWFNQFEYEESGDVRIYPTHWMPLPEPPQQ